MELAATLFLLTALIIGLCTGRVDAIALTVANCFGAALPTSVLLLLAYHPDSQFINLPVKLKADSEVQHALVSRLLRKMALIVSLIPLTMTLGLLTHKPQLGHAGIWVLCIALLLVIMVDSRKIHRAGLLDE